MLCAQGVEPPHDGERRKMIDDQNANVPAVFVAYISRIVVHEDMPALELLGTILTDGEASRMHRRLVKEEEAAVVVFGGVDVEKAPAFSGSSARRMWAWKSVHASQLMMEEIDKVKAEGISSGEELEKAKVQFKSGTSSWGVRRFSARPRRSSAMCISIKRSCPKSIPISTIYMAVTSGRHHPCRQPRISLKITGRLLLRCPLPKKVDDFRTTIRLIMNRYQRRKKEYEMAYEKYSRGPVALSVWQLLVGGAAAKQDPPAPEK